MKLHCLGTTGYHPSPTRHTACYYAPDWNLVLDAGTGIFRLVEHLRRVPKKHLDLFLTHAHLDHIVGLTFLVDVYAVTDLESVRVIGDGAKLAAVQEHLFNDLLFPVKPQMEFCSLDGESGEQKFGETAVEWFPLEHPGGSIGYIMEREGKRFAYITDTIARDKASYVERLRGADLLLHECYFGDEYQELAEKTGHSWISAVESVVSRTRPKQTVLIHLNPLAETLGNSIELTEAHQRLGMSISEDCMEIDF
ncbi:MAG: MBL fold metallo-hydrolase [Pirellulaceae bacterium]